jgi:hypothetical protein
LRARTLESAGEALGRGPEIWTRIWESPLVRLGWAAAALILVVGHAGLSLRGPAPEPSRASSGARAGAEGDLAEIVQLPHVYLATDSRLARLEQAIESDSEESGTFLSGGQDEEERL